MDKEMRRLDACIDACAGVSTEALESGAIKELREAMKTFFHNLYGRKYPNGCSAEHMLEVIGLPKMEKAFAKLGEPDA